jgi:hypothetical protein
MFQSIDVVFVRNPAGFSHDNFFDGPQAFAILLYAGRRVSSRVLSLIVGSELVKSHYERREGGREGVGLFVVVS